MSNDYTNQDNSTPISPKDWGLGESIVHAMRYDSLISALRQQKRGTLRKELEDQIPPDAMEQLQELANQLNEYAIANGKQPYLNPQKDLVDPNWKEVY